MREQAIQSCSVEQEWAAQEVPALHGKDTDAAAFAASFSAAPAEPASYTAAASYAAAASFAAASFSAAEPAAAAFSAAPAEPASAFTSASA